MRKRKVISRTLLEGQNFTFLVCSLLAFILVLSLQSTSKRPFVSTEVKFTDASSGGLSIMPASCPSNPDYDPGHDTCVIPCPTPLPGAPSNSAGYKADTQSGGLRAARNTSPICVTNSSSNSYFVPASTTNEINLFKTNLPPGAGYTEVQ